MSRTDAQNQLIPLRHGFVSVHPDPAGIVHFIGGYFFGTGANFWYRGLLNELKQKFTVHVYSYPFTELSHWKLAYDLLEQIEQVNKVAAQDVQRWGYQTDIYSDPSKHCLLGHSLGCECITLIRFLGFNQEQQLQCLHEARDVLGSKEVKEQDFFDVESLPQQESVPYKASLLMAPCFKTPVYVDWLIDVRPKQLLMRYLIEKEPTLLPISSLISFKNDTIAEADVESVRQTLAQQKSLINVQEIAVDRKWRTALPYHMIPAFDPIQSGLSDCAANFIYELVNPEPSTATSTNSNLPEAGVRSQP
ncbi:MAG TPA: DUF1350 family protein [Waterburya sp.]|jgi:hypothetical protein